MPESPCAARPTQTASCCTRNKICITSSTLLFLCCLALTILLAGFIVTRNFKYGTYYVVILDAGSTSTKVSLYKWADFPFRRHGYVDQVDTSTVNKTTFSISTDLVNPGESLKQITRQLNQINNFIPQESLHATNVYLGATAGMRIATYKDANASKRVIDELVSLLSDKQRCKLKLGNREKDVGIISGSDEGIYAWITANYANRAFGEITNQTISPALKTVGALDMGGASTQITFAISDEQADLLENNPQLIKRKHLFGQDYRIFSRSMLCNGKSEFDQLRKAILLLDAFHKQEDKNNWPATVDDGCFYSREISEKDNYHYTNDLATTVDACKNLFHGQSPVDVSPFMDRRNSFRVNFVGPSNYETCRESVTRVLDLQGLGVCDSRWCYYKGERAPRAMGQFYAFTGFYYIVNHLKKQKQTKKNWFTLTEYRTMVKELCATQNTIFCYDGVYFEQLLMRYGFDTDDQFSKITFIKEVNNITMSWAMGYAIDRSGLIPGRMPAPYVNMQMFIGISLPFILIALLLVFILYRIRCGSAKRQRRGQEPGPCNANGDDYDQQSGLADGMQMRDSCKGHKEPFLSRNNHPV